jgi:4-carboxymuconolactone decarboxylase
MQTKTTDQRTGQPAACGHGPCTGGGDPGPTDYETLARRCPGLSIADDVDPDLADVLRQYHHHVWGGEGVLPLKYKYLMALATAVTGREKQRALLETRKALAHGATPAEVRETLALGLWLAGAPRLVDVVGPVVRMLEKREGNGDAEA